MRIFQVLEYSANPAVSGNRTWYRNLYEPLVEMGHEVFLFPAEEGREARRRRDSRLLAQFSQRVLEAFRAAYARGGIDLFFAYVINGMLDPGVLGEVRRSGVPTCNFSCNNAHQFYLVDTISPHFDYNLHAERDARDKFLAVGATPLWWPMASNPRYFAPRDVKRDVAVSFVGANYALRARYVTHLLEHGVDVHAYGPAWESGATDQWRSVARRYQYAIQALLARTTASQFGASARLAEHDLRRILAARFPHNVHSPVSDDDLIALYSRSEISLGFLEVYDHHDPSRLVTQHLHLREFEAPMSGALYCTGFSDELAEMFEPDHEVITYQNQFELLDKVRYYLARPDEANQIRAAGLARARRDHTYHVRFQRLFAELRLPVKVM